MTFRAIRRTDLATGYSPFRVVDEQGRELEWLNRFLDMQVRARPGALTLRSYAHKLLHFVRWWARRPWYRRDALHHRAVHRGHPGRLRARSARRTTQTQPENINDRAGILRRLFQFYFHEEMPHGPYRLQRTWLRRSPLGYGRRRVGVAPDLKVKVPQRAIVPLAAERWPGSGPASARRAI